MKRKSVNSFRILAYARARVRAFALSLAAFLPLAILASTGFTESETLVSSYNGKELKDGKVYVASDGAGAIFTALSTKSALRVADGATVVIYIPKGKKLTANGADASGTTGAGAGIEVPTNSTLIVTGGGELDARGGDAANGVGGGNGSSGSFRSGLDYWTAGTGGGGGAGGGGGGAAIGGVGGTGGTGGGGGTSWENECHYFSANEYTANGSGGNGGSGGGNGTSSGTLYLLGSLNATATGGGTGFWDGGAASRSASRARISAWRASVRG